MAAVVGSIISITLQKIGELVIQQVRDTYGVRDKLKSIEKDLVWIRCFLQDADRKLGQADKRLEKLVADMFAIARKIEDAVDTFRLREERQRRRGPFKKYVSGWSDFVSLKRIGKAIEEIKKEISDVYARKETYGVPDFDGREGPSYVSKKLQVYRRAAALAVGVEVVGFAKHVEELVERLIGRGGEAGDSRHRCVVSIVAPGGAGKTTLATKVFNSDRVRNYFHDSGVAAWVCVSQTYNVESLLREVAEQVKCSSIQNSKCLNEKVLQDRLSEFLQEKRYLIVLDDMWDADAWVQLKAAFPDAENGSRIIITTRNAEVARHAASDRPNLPFHLPSLNEEDSWKLFLKKAFPWEETSTEIPCSSSSSQAELTDVGKEIVKKCGGLPLAISVVGGLLAAKGEAKVQDWKDVLVSLTDGLSEESGHCQDIIALSYYDLPYHLKPCFLYLGLFPEDDRIFAGQLKMLWIAEGFIQPKKGRETEDLADDYLEELIDRSLVQVHGSMEDGSVVICRIHDLLHAFAISEGTKYNFLAVDGKKISTPTTFSTIEARWLAVHDLEDVLRDNNILNVRSLLCFNRDVVSLSALSKGLKLLRVLKLDLNSSSSSSSIIKDFPSEELTHLRYLDLRGYVTMRVLLSPSIGNLYNLETLILPISVCLPKELWKLHRLMHLDARNCEFEGEPRVCNLNNLHTLNLGMGSWIEEATVVSSLGGLRNLTIEGAASNVIKPLWMERLGNLVSKLVNLRSIDVCLMGKHNHAITLTLEGHTHLSVLRLYGVKLGRLSKLAPKLTKVKLEGSQLSNDQMPTLETLTDLVSLDLGFDVYPEKKMILSANGFPQLKYLGICSMDQLEELVVEQGAMPKLEILEISMCKNFKLVEGLQCSSTLRRIEFFDPLMELKNRLEKAMEEDWYKKVVISTIDDIFGIES